MKLKIKQTKNKYGFFTAQVFMDGLNISDSVTAIEIKKDNINPFEISLKFSCEIEIEIDELEEINRITNAKCSELHYIEQEKTKKQ